MMHNRKKDWIFACIVVTVHTVYFLLARHYTRIYMGDSFEYIYEALNIKSHFFFYSGNPALPIQPEYMTQRQPLYPLFVAGVYLFSINNWLVLILQNLLSVFNMLYARRFAVSLGFDTAFDWLLIIFFIGLPSQFINANTIAPDILLQTCALLYAANVIVFFRKGTNGPLLWSSMMLTAGMLVKPVLYPFVFVHVVLLLAVMLVQKRNVWQIIMPALMPVAVMLLYCGWNEERTGKFHFSSNQAFNAIYYYQPYITKKFNPDSAARFVANEREQIAALPTYRQQYDRANARGGELLRQNWGSYIPFHLTHSARMLLDPGKAEIDLFTGRLTYGNLYSGKSDGFYAAIQEGTRGVSDYLGRNPTIPLIMLILLLNLMKFGGLLLFVFSRRVSLFIRIFVACFIAYFALAAGPISNARYFLPVSLLAAGCAAISWSKLMGGSKTAVE